jgi:hypothetical protein
MYTLGDFLNKINEKVANPSLVACGSWLVSESRDPRPETRVPRTSYETPSWRILDIWDSIQNQSI